MAPLPNGRLLVLLGGQLKQGGFVDFEGVYIMEKDGGPMHLVCSAAGDAFGVIECG